MSSLIAALMELCRRRCWDCVSCACCVTKYDSTETLALMLDSVCSGAHASTHSTHSHQLPTNRHVSIAKIDAPNCTRHVNHFSLFHTRGPTGAVIMSNINHFSLFHTRGPTGAVIMSNIFLSAAVLDLAAEAAGCDTDNLQDCEGRIYGMRPEARKKT